MNKYIIGLFVTISFFSCKKSTTTAPVDPCPGKHPITLKFGIKTASSATYYATYYNGTNTNVINHLLPTSNGNIVFTNNITGYEGCNCQSNGINGTMATFSLTGEVNFGTPQGNNTIPFTAYIILGTDTIAKQQSVVWNGKSFAFVDVTGCLKKL